jgi:hypothetical protein
VFQEGADDDESVIRILSSSREIIMKGWRRRPSQEAWRSSCIFSFANSMAVDPAPRDAAVKNTCLVLLQVPKKRSILEHFEKEERKEQ